MILETDVYKKQSAEGSRARIPAGNWFKKGLGVASKEWT